MGEPTATKCPECNKTVDHRGWWQHLSWAHDMVRPEAPHYQEVRNGGSPASEPEICDDCGNRLEPVREYLENVEKHNPKLAENDQFSAWKAEKTRQYTAVCPTCSSGGTIAFYE